MKKIAALVLGATLAFSGTGSASAGGDKYYGSLKDAPAPVAAVGWSGLHVGVAVGYSWTDTDLTHDLEIACCGANPYSYGGATDYDVTTTTGHDADGVTGTVTFGYDHQIGPKMVVGVFADYTFGEDSSNGVLFYPGSSEGVELNYGPAWSVGGRVGFLLRPETMIYFNAGYTQADFEMVSLLGNGSLKKDMDGYFLGVGGVHKLRDGLALTLEYRYTSYGSERLGSYQDICCYEAFDVDVDNHAVRLGIAFQLAKPAPVYHEPLK